MSDDITTITVTRETRNRLFRKKREPGETYEDVLQRVLSDPESDGQ